MVSGGPSWLLVDHLASLIRPNEAINGGAQSLIWLAIAVVAVFVADVVVVVVVSRWNLSWFFVGPSLASLGEAICPPERSRGAVIGLVDSMSVQVKSSCCLVLSRPTLPSNPPP